jgi:hypothetical protein
VNWRVFLFLGVYVPHRFSLNTFPPRSLEPDPRGLSEPTGFPLRPNKFDSVQLKLQLEPMDKYKRLLFIVVFFFSCVGAGAQNNVVFKDGTPGWTIANGFCTFDVQGGILNQSPPGSVSGTLRLCLWITANPISMDEEFTGYRVATYSLGQLRGEYEWSNIRPRCKVSIPRLTGNFYITPVLEQYDGSGYTMSDVGTGALKYLKNGAFVTPRPWSPPKGAVVTPKGSVKVGDTITVTMQGSQLESGGPLAFIPSGSQLKLAVKIKANGITSVYGGIPARTTPALYTYDVQDDQHGGRNCRVGMLHLDYGALSGTDSTATYSLFFQRKDKGFYKGVHPTWGILGTDWGVFTLK